MDDVTSDVIEPLGYHNDNFYVIRNWRKGLLPIITFICIIITQSGGFMRVESQKRENITKIFPNKNYLHRPIFMFMEEYSSKNIEVSTFPHIFREKPYFCSIELIWHAQKLLK